MSKPWILDPAHTAVEFEISHMHVSTFRGRFGVVEGKLSLDEATPGKSALEASIDVRSLEVRDQGLYGRLMGDDFFRAEKNPRIHYRSTKVERTDETHWKVEGELTLAGITRPVPLTVEDLGGGNHPFARAPMKAYRAEGALDRADFGMTWNAPLDTGAKYLGERVRLLLQVEVVQR